MKKHIFLLPLLVLILSLILGTSVPFGTTTSIGSATIDADILSAHSRIGTLFNNITAVANATDLPLVQQQENNEGVRIHGTYVSEDSVASQQAPAAKQSPETETDEKFQAPGDSGESKEETKEPEEPKETKKQAPPTPKPVARQTPDVKQMARVTASSLNVRTGPSTDSQRIDALTMAQTVEVLAEQNNWLQIKLPDGQTGWIAGWHTTVYTPGSGNGSLAGKVIAIDPGHGGADPGAVGVTGLPEKEVVLDVSLRVADKLRAEGADVIMTRDTDVFIPLSGRVSIAEAAGADVYVSVHVNAHPNPQIGGTETYYFRNSANSSASFTLASHMQQELVRTLGLRDIGVKDGNFLVIRQTSMPSVLLELGFLSNAQEESLMRTNDFRKNSADAIVRGLQNYFN